MKGREFTIFLLIAATVAAAAWTIYQRESGLDSSLVLQLELRDKRLRDKELEIAALRKTLSDAQGKAAAASATSPPVPKAAGDAAPPSDTTIDESVPQAARRLSLVRKFLDLSPAESLRLEEYFMAHDGTAQPEILARAIEAELGKEQADFYRDQVNRAFDRAEQEEEEKEVLLLSRRLGLTIEQEASLTEVYRRAAELNADEERAAHQNTDHPRASQQMARYLEAVKIRRRFIDERVRPLLTAEQFRVYAELQAQSNEQELHLWHGKE